MDQQSLLNLFFGLFSAVAGWFAREMWSAVKMLQGDLSKLREAMPEKYVAKDDFKEGVNEIKNMLSRIFDRLDNKADK